MTDLTDGDTRRWQPTVVRVVGALGLLLVIAVTLGAYGLSAMATDPCGTPETDPDCFARAALISRGVLLSGAAGAVVLVATTLWPRATRSERARALGLLAIPGALIGAIVFLSTPLS